jgi:FkbM family methyltransferase
MMNSIFLQYISTKSGKKKYQNFFEELYRLSLKGMNIGSGDAIITSGEKCAIEFIEKRLNNPGRLIVFDVGANVGDYSVLLKDVLKERAEIFAFEPSGAAFQQLILHTKNFSNFNRFNFGFGDNNETLTLFSNAEASGLASIYKRRLEHFSIKMDLAEKIEVKTIDDFCLEHSIAHIHFLKLDVEGHELKVLKGAEKMIGAHNIDFIQFEFGGCNIDSRTFFQDFFYFFKNDFIVYRIVKDGLYKIENYQEMYEAFATTNYLAERKTL